MNTQFLAETVCSCERKIDNLRADNNLLLDKIRNLQLQSDVLATRLARAESLIEKYDDLTESARGLFIDLLVNLGHSKRISDWLEQATKLLQRRY